MKSKRQRYIFRFAFLILFASAVGYMLYQHYNQNDKAAMIGDPAPDFKLKSLTSNSVNLENYKGKVVLINFWGSWCEPCKQEMPLLQSTYEQYKKSGFEVLALNMQESPFVVSRFIKDYHVTFPVLLDREKEVSRAYNVYKLPASFILDQSGKVRYMQEGELTKKILHKWVTELM